MPGLLDFISLRDMFDGGGPGAAGDTFKGGPFSGFLNDLGVKPMGYLDRMAQMPRPQPRPAALGQRPPAMPPLPPPDPYSLPITQTALPPPGAMPNEELIRMILQALQAPPGAIGYGPR
jgi:hypothetical protein